MAESEAAATERRVEALVAGTSDVIAVVSPDSTVRYVSSAVVDVFGRQPDDVVGQRAIRVIHPEDLEVVTLLLDRQPSDSEESTVERATFRMAHADGHWRWVEAMVRNLLDDPAVEGLVVGLRDVTAAKRAEETLAGQTRVLELIARGAPLGETLDLLTRLAEGLTQGALVSVMLVDPSGSMLVPVAAPSLPAAAIVALSAGVPIGAGSGACGSAAFGRRLVIVEDAATDPLFADWRDLALANGLLACWSTPITNEETGQVLGTFATYYREVRRPTEEEIAALSRFGDLAGIAVERKQAEDRLAHQALHDPLTGLPNRALFLDRLRHAVDQVERRPGMIAVLFCDLDSFKVINDWLGHDAGDRVLTNAAARLHATLRVGDTAARFGGDEFVVLCENVQTEQDVVALAERVAVALAEPLLVGTDEVTLTCSIGISVSHTGDVDPEGLLRDADTAMYQAKARGKARFELYDNEMRQKLHTRLEVQDALRRAVSEGELCVHYQPEVSLRDGSVAGVEALVRWEHPQRGLVGPDEFIGVASETSLIVAIGNHVIAEACRQAREFNDRGPEIAPITVWVNLSMRQLCHPDLVATVASALAESAVEPAIVGFEIPERDLMEDPEAALRVLQDLARLGVGLGVDDFAHGNSSLTYLNRFPVSRVKIDRSLVADLGGDRDRGPVVQSAVGLAHLLGLKVVAAGLETRDELDELRRIGCDAGQGWLFAQAAPADRLVELLTGPPLTG